MMPAEMRLILMVGSVRPARVKQPADKDSHERDRRRGLEIPRWDPSVTKAVVGLLRPLVKRYHRSEVAWPWEHPAQQVVLSCRITPAANSPWT